LRELEADMPKHHASATQLSAVAAFILGLLSVTIDGHAQQTSTPKSEEAERGIRLYLAGERDQAEEALRVAVKRRQDDADAWFYLGLTLHYPGRSPVEGRYAEGIQAFKTAAVLRPEASAWYGIGRDLTRMDRIREALQAYELALGADPGFVPAISARASLFLLSNGLSGAAATAERALKLDPGNAEAHWVVSMAQLRQVHCNPAEALRAAKLALQTQPDFAPARLLKYLALTNIFINSLSDAKFSQEEQLLQLADATAALEEFLKQNPTAAEGDLWRGQLESLLTYADFVGRPEANTMANDLRSSAIRMPRIIHRERSEYTEKARLADVEGLVSVSVIVDSNGTVHGLLVLRPLSHGLTESALEAASKCRFEPATRHGHPISMRVELHSAYMQQPAIPKHRQR